MSERRKPVTKDPTKDPRGGLTAAGRAAFARSQGAHLKPGVKKQRVADMSPQDMRRKEARPSASTAAPASCRRSKTTRASPRASP